MSLKTIRTIIALCAIVILSGGLGYRFGQARVINPKAPFSSVEILHKEPQVLTSVDFGQFWEVWNKLSQNYMDKTVVDPQKMVYGAISGMVGSLDDPYTVFLTPEQNRDTKEELGGSFEGIGAQLGFKDKQLIVIAPLKGTPAEQAGVLSGDAILRIDNKDTAGVTLPEAVSKIRGPKGTKVKLTIAHVKEEKPIDLEITRETIIVKSVEWEKKEAKGKSIALIKLSRFGDSTNLEWDNVVSEIKRVNISRIILDLRNDPGGYLSGAVYIANEFLPSGTIVIQESGNGQKTVQNVSRKGKFISEKVIVLINKGSASASEIVAGALQNSKRGLLVGETSFGKGTVQEVLDLEKGAGLHITTAKWLLPSGRWIDKVGLKPDIEVSQDEKDPTVDLQFNRALELIVKD